MSVPSHAQVTVATDVLRKEAAEWEHQAQAVGQIATRASGLGLGRLEAGLFQLIVGAYNDVVDQVSARCREGATAMNDIAHTLRHVADTYDEEDRRNEHRIRRIY